MESNNPEIQCMEELQAKNPEEYDEMLVLINYSQYSTVKFYKTLKWSMGSINIEKTIVQKKVHEYVVSDSIY